MGISSSYKDYEMKTADKVLEQALRDLVAFDKDYESILPVMTNIKTWNMEIIDGITVFMFNKLMWVILSRRHGKVGIILR